MNLVNKLITADKQSPRKILVIGDAMTDVYIHGHLEECEDGCNKFVRESCVEVAGGSANASRSLINWSALTANVYDKRYGAVKTRLMVGDKCVIRYDNDIVITKLDTVRYNNMGMLHEWKPDAVLLSDYDKGLLTPEFIQEVIGICKDRTIPCVADAKRNTDLYKGAIIKGNQEWYNKGGVGDVITWGALSPLVDRIRLRVNTKPVICVNHVGAGDCFAAHLTLALAYGFSLKESSEIAYSAGRVYVQHRHNCPPHPEEIALDMDS